jgi:YD repeat-containing protein
VIEVSDDNSYTIYKFNSLNRPDRETFMPGSPMRYYLTYSDYGFIEPEVVVAFFAKRSGTALERGVPSEITQYTNTDKKVKSVSYIYNTDAGRYNDNKIVSIDFPVAPARYSDLLQGEEIYTPFYTTSEWYYFNTQPTQQVETWYASDGTTPTLATTTNFTYNADRLLSQKSTVKSNDVEDIMKYQYVGDYTYTGGSDVFADMRALHILSPLVEQQKLQKVGSTTTLLDGTLSWYAKWNSVNIFRPLYIKKLALSSPSSTLTMSYMDGGSLTGHSGYSSVNAEIEYASYTRDGNPQQFTLKGVSAPVTYIWSYDGQFPVAEIRNATFSDAETAYGSSLTSFKASMTPNISSLGSTLRSGLSGAQVSVYTYDPFAGILTMTDAKGKTTSYEYDSYERLKHLKDQDGNIVKSYDYHYKGE